MASSSPIVATGPGTEGEPEQTFGEQVNDAVDAVKEFLPIPADTEPVTDPFNHDVSNSMAEEPTLSHALALDDHEEKGRAQQDHFEEDVLDLGWNEKKERIAAPPGRRPGQRRSQLYHVKESTKAVPGNLDLNIADEEEFSPDKLRAQIERLYTEVIINLISVVKHAARLRSWRETRRTSAFCAVYFIAWLFDFVVPLLSVTLITLIAYPPARGVLFPPAPIALVDANTGGVQKPKAGVLGSHGSATGAPENHKGEAVEQEASNFFNGITAIILTSATGKHPQGDGEGSGENDRDENVPDPTAMAVGAADAKDIAAGGKPSPHHDKTKKPVESAMWSKMRPLMKIVGDITDTWERFANALSPTPPFPQHIYRMRLASLIVPLLFTSLFVTSYMFMKGVTFGIGFGFFGDPVITRGIRFLNREFPHWEKLLELRNTVLKGVPTNAQLTLTLLRIGEANKAPLPPPPRVGEAPPDRPVGVTDDELRATGAEPPLNATDAELDEAMRHDPHTAHETSGSDIDAAKSAKHGSKGRKLVNLLKSTTKGAVKTAMGADTVRAKAGSSHAKHRLGAAPKPTPDLLSGPVDFQARYKGHKGHVYISTKATIPAVAFSTDVTVETIGSAEREDLHPKWSVPIADLRELKKIGGYGWKYRMMVGWSLGREIADGLELTDRTGTTYKLTALPLRDELFNRLIAMGGTEMGGMNCFVMLWVL
ncbi:uncharacterized protein PG986_013003 [Apiospora aurea]|uniref:Peroxin domain-containing protein n=1 Tax=Apiospora aurea TaxID=335848 RepID=A0ABR1Q1L3_9PEZI